MRLDFIHPRAANPTGELLCVRQLGLRLLSLMRRTALKQLHHPELVLHKTKFFQSDLNEGLWCLYLFEESVSKRVSFYRAGALES